MRTREGMAIARTRGKLRGQQPKLSDRQRRELCRMHATGEYSTRDFTSFSLSHGQPSMAHSTGGFPPNVLSAPYRIRPGVVFEEVAVAVPVDMDAIFLVGLPIVEKLADWVSLYDAAYRHCPSPVRHSASRPRVAAVRWRLPVRCRQRWK